MCVCTDSHVHEAGVVETRSIEDVLDFSVSRLLSLDHSKSHQLSSKLDQLNIFVVYLLSTI